jgi:hypothetical protein
MPTGRSLVGSTPSQSYGVYLQFMRRIGHYRWFSLLMKHVGTNRSGADPGEPRPLVDERSPDADNAAHD